MAWAAGGPAGYRYVSVDRWEAPDTGRCRRAGLPDHSAWRVPAKTAATQREESIAPRLQLFGELRCACNAWCLCQSAVTVRTADTEDPVSRVDASVPEHAADGGSGGGGAGAQSVVHEAAAATWVSAG